MAIIHYEHPDDKRKSRDIDVDKVGTITSVYEFEKGHGFGFAITFLHEQGKKVPFIFSTKEEADVTRMKILGSLPE